MKLKSTLSWLAIKIFGNIQFFPAPFHLVLNGDTHYQIKGPEMREILNKIEPGDILLRRYDRYVSSWFIPGYYKHVAIVSSKESIIQATTGGTFEEDILTFLRADEVAILRIKKLPKREVSKAIKFAKNQIGKPYDFSFSSHDKRFYCSELVAACYENRFLDLKTGKKIISPDAFFAQDLEVIHDSRQFREMHP